MTGVPTPSGRRGRISTGTVRRARAARIANGDPPAGGTTRRFRLAMRVGEWSPPDEPVLSRTLPSRLDLKQAAIDEVADLLVGRGWVAEADRPWLVLCLDEAITNAMLHGNEGDPRLEVAIVVARDGPRWQVAVSDRGDGFTAAAVPDPDDPESLLLEHGRGIRLMRSWLDALTYWRRGATVVMARRCADQPRG